MSLVRHGFFQSKAMNSLAQPIAISDLDRNRKQLLLAIPLNKANKEEEEEEERELVAAEASAAAARFCFIQAG